MSKARAVLISDVHFNINTLSLAKQVLTQAILHAYELGVSLIIAGDLNDTKAIIRGEVANALIEVLSKRAVDADGNYLTQIFLLVGNHDLINEKSKAHTLNFLSPYVELVDEKSYADQLGLYMIPYHADKEELRKTLADIPSGSTLIMHQGLLGAHMGEYAVDKSSIEPTAFANYRVISGHYHRAQDIKCGPPRKGALGLFSYIGTPYSVTFAEAEDGPKGFRVLKMDGTLEFVPTNVRKHVKHECSYKRVMDPIEGLNPGDLLWLKVTGPRSELDKLSKKTIGIRHLGHQNFKFDPIYDTADIELPKTQALTKDQLLDKIIDDSEETKTQKTYLKSLWRDIIS